MPTLTIRNVPAGTVASLKRLARTNRRSMQQEVRTILEEAAGDREAALDAIEAEWSSQRRRPRPAEVDRWIERGRR